MKPVTRTYESAWWSIDLPEGWNVTHDSECTTITSHNLGGTLQLSAYRKKSDIAEDELAGLVEDDHELEPICFGEVSSVQTTYDDGDERWRSWWLIRGPTLIFATYNGSLLEFDENVMAAEEVLKTLRVFPAA